MAAEQESDLKQEKKYLDAIFWGGSILWGACQMLQPGTGFGRLSS
jgi:hypothetical protein